MSKSNNPPYKHLSVILMPTDFCNMNCVYCFNERRTSLKTEKMSIETIDKIFSITIPYYDEIRFIWHGGEPTAMGLDFFQTAIEMQKTYHHNGMILENSIQSNLTMLSDELIDFFIKNNFHIGSSFDGTKNESTRHNSKKILEGRQRIIDAGGKVGVICVVQSNNIDCLIDDYEWFKEHGINYTLNMYLTPPPFENNRLYVSPEKFAKKICELFDYWIFDKNCNINLSFFADFLNFIFYKKKNLCSYNSCLGKHIGIRSNGDIYNCNRDFNSEYCYGNVFDYSDIRECFNSDGFCNSVNAAYLRREYCKNNCEIFGFCEGGCNSVAQTGSDMSKPYLDFCSSLKMVFNHISSKVEALLSQGYTAEELNPYLHDYFTIDKPTE